MLISTHFFNDQVRREYYRQLEAITELPPHFALKSSSTR